MAKKKKIARLPRAAAPAPTEPAPVAEIDAVPPTMTPDDLFEAFITGAAGAAAKLAFWGRIYERMKLYYRLFPDRYAHMVAFCENRIDDPKPADTEAVLKRAREVFGGS